MQHPHDPQKENEEEEAKNNARHKRKVDLFIGFPHHHLHLPLGQHRDGRRVAGASHRHGSKVGAGTGEQEATERNSSRMAEGLVARGWGATQSLRGGEEGAAGRLSSRMAERVVVRRREAQGPRG